MKDELISSMGSWCDGVWNWNIMWNRNLRVGEEAQFEELKSLLSTTSLTQFRDDSSFSCLLPGKAIFLLGSSQFHRRVQGGLHHLDYLGVKEQVRSSDMNFFLFRDGLYREL
ncbi:hypothetical protein OIU77_024998 [Salix suchowensis]|uniref:Uncharacterized protein n=1 Tax=Salix suchowensis TaxID=1278906 RepID=A0ABQ9BXW9_9ROSI|nr:hypothetical protein OIU77_024998 [Salix suchowensis]